MPVRGNDTFIPVDGHMVGSQRNEHTVGPYKIDKEIRRENQREKTNTMRTVLNVQIIQRL